MTLPLCRLDVQVPWYQKTKQHFNKQLRKQCVQWKGIVLIDLAQNHNFLAKKNPHLLFSDDLHFSEKGYDLLANILYKSITPFIKA
jgi:lysophospholipase L1-like esterase